MYGLAENDLNDKYLPNMWKIKHLYSKSKTIIYMQFDPDNKVVQPCDEGMELEGQGKKDEARHPFQKAWEMAVNDFEKFTSEH